MSVNAPSWPGRGTRGRVLMLVDNGVHGDSRVQKAAASAAAAGWDVILLGKYPGKGDEHWQLGDADVHLVKMTPKLSVSPKELRGTLLRRPLAYQSARVQGYREAHVKAWRSDLRVRADARRSGGPGGKAGSPLGLAVPKLAAKVTASWVKLRTRQTKQLAALRRTRSAPLDRLVTRFWLTTMRERAWRRLSPNVWDFELSFGPVIDALGPDLIHANDFRMLGVGARAAVRGRAAGRGTKLVWDAHEFVPGVRSWANKRTLPAMVGYEREHARYADAVMTVSEGLAELLRDTHGLKELPAVVLNAPAKAVTQKTVEEPVPDIRELCGVGPDVPLLVYSGLAAAQRGLDIMVEGLPELPGAHAVFVCGDPQAPYVRGLLKRAEELGVGDRAHAVPYVSHWQIVPFLSGATVGVIPIHHWPNHEIALITKFFEYSHAGLPLVVSDVKTMSKVTRETGQGEVFTAKDTADYVRAVREVLADPERYTKAYAREGLLEEWTWEAQAKVLDGVYTRLLRPEGAR